jgi:hypothetical protein
MAHPAVTVEGGLISGDLLEQIAAAPQDVQGQRAGDFGVDGRLSDEVQKAFSDALTYWNASQTCLQRAKGSATTITRETWMLPLMEELGYSLVFQRSAVQVGGNSYSISHLRRSISSLASRNSIGRVTRRGAPCAGSGLSQPL